VRLHRDYIATNQAPKDDGNNEPDLHSVAYLPDLSGFSIDNKFNVCRPPTNGYFCNKDKNLDKGAVSIKKGALLLTDKSEIFMSEEDIDKYSSPYLQFVFSYCFNIVLACNALVFHVYNYHAHETCINAEVFHQLAHAMISLAAGSFVCQLEKKDCKVKEHKYMLEQI
jgi:hypothetical protein